MRFTPCLLLSWPLLPSFLTSLGSFNGIFRPKENLTLVNENQRDHNLKPTMKIPSSRPSGLQDI